jgi:hypothetical protein
MVLPETPHIDPNQGDGGEAQGRATAQQRNWVVTGLPLPTDVLNDPRRWVTSEVTGSNGITAKVLSRRPGSVPEVDPPHPGVEYRGTTYSTDDGNPIPRNR